MKGVIYAATAGAGALFLGALFLFASFLGGVPWRAFERPPQRLGRVPAVLVPDEPVVLTMTASDVDSVPEALEVRPRIAAPAEPERAAALGDVEPRTPKAAAKKAPARKPTLFQKVGLGGGRRTLQLGPGFDGGGNSSGGSGAFAGGAAASAEGEPEEAPSRPSGGAAPARARTLRALTPTRGTSGPAPVAAPAEEEPAGDDEGE